MTLGWGNMMTLDSDYDDGPKLKYAWPMPAHSSGIDCSGLAYLSAVGKASDTGSMYTCGSTTDANHMGTDSFASDANTLQIRAGGWLISKKEATDEEKLFDQKLLTYAVPGDILVKVGHVVIIQNITSEIDDQGNFIVKDTSKVDVIHSTSGIQGAWNTWQIHKGNWTQIH